MVGGRASVDTGCMRSQAACSLFINRPNDIQTTRPLDTGEECKGYESHDTYERFRSREEGGPGYQTVCLNCGVSLGPIMTVEETIANQAKK